MKFAAAPLNDLWDTFGPKDGPGSYQDEQAVGREVLMDRDGGEHREDQAAEDQDEPEQKHTKKQPESTVERPADRMNPWTGPGSEEQNQSHHSTDFLSAVNRDPNIIWFPEDQLNHARLCNKVYEKRAATGKPESSNVSTPCPPLPTPGNWSETRNLFFLISKRSSKSSPSEIRAGL